MKEKQTDLNGALEWIGELHDQLADQFLSDFAQLPSFGEPTLDAEVAIYADGLGNWVRANDKWSFEVSDFIFLPTHLILMWSLSYRARGILASRALRSRNIVLLLYCQRRPQLSRSLRRNNRLQRRFLPVESGPDCGDISYLTTPSIIYFHYSLGRKFGTRSIHV